MRKNCNLDRFSLSPFSSTNYLPVPLDRHQIPFMDVTTISTTNHRDGVIITFNGRVLVCDMTELLARAIILFATRGSDGKKNGKGSDLKLSNFLPSQTHGSPTLSMKRSLQRFLQKRKQRNRASSPYAQ